MHIGQMRTYVLLIHRCRRFFPEEAHQEIWDACWPAMPQLLIPQSFEVGLAGWPSSIAPGNSILQILMQQHCRVGNPWTPPAHV